MDNVVCLDYKAKELGSFKINKSDNGNMDDRLPVENIEKVKIKWKN